MQPNPATGFFDVEANEAVTITVEVINNPYSASFPHKPSAADWCFQQGPKDGKETRQFVAPEDLDTRCAVDIVFDFAPDTDGGYPSGTQYKVTVSGSKGAPFTDVPIDPPPVQTRQYIFRVV